MCEIKVYGDARRTGDPCRSHTRISPNERTRRNVAGLKGRSDWRPCGINDVGKQSDNFADISTLRIKGGKDNITRLTRVGDKVGVKGEIPENELFLGFV